MTLRYIELFCGVGGFHEAIRTTGLNAKCVFAYDRSQRAKRMYETNFKSYVHRQMHVRNIPAFDLLCAVPTNLNDHIPLIHDVVSLHKPKYILLDLPKKCDHCADMSRRFKDCGYHVYTKILNGTHFGLPQYRERTFVLCIRSDINNTGFQWEDIIQPVKPVKIVRDILEEKADMDVRKSLEEKYDIVPFHGRVIGHRPLQVLNLVRKDNGKGERQGERIYSNDHPGIAICYCSGSPGSYSGIYDVHGVLRNLTVTEALRMFGFADTYQYSQFVSVPERMLRMLGESTMIPVVQAILRRLFFSTMESRGPWQKTTTPSAEDVSSTPEPEEK